MWFHVSQDNGINAIIRSDATRELNEISPRIPLDCYGENQEIKRVCIAPTIWQCLVSIPKHGTLYIYRVDTPLVSVPIDGTADDRMTSEKWITDHEVNAAGGRILMSRLGFIVCTKEVITSLKVQYRRGKLPMAHSEENQLWDLIGDEYSLKTCWLM